MSEPEIVPPSSEPDAATATGTGSPRAAEPPPPLEESAGMGGVGTEAERSASGSAPPANAPYSLTGESNETDSASGSGT